MTLPDFLTTDSSFVEDVSNEVKFALHNPTAIDILRSLEPGSADDATAKWRRVEIETFFFVDSRFSMLERATKVLCHFAREMKDAFAITDVKAHLHRLPIERTGMGRPMSSSPWVSNVRGPRSTFTTGCGTGMLCVKLLLVSTSRIKPEIPAKPDDSDAAKKLKYQLDMINWCSYSKPDPKDRNSGYIDDLDGTETRLTIHEEAKCLLFLNPGTYGSRYKTIFEQMISALNVGRLETYSQDIYKYGQTGRLVFLRDPVIYVPTAIVKDVVNPDIETLVIRHAQGCVHTPERVQYSYGQCSFVCSSCKTTLKTNL